MLISITSQQALLLPVSYQHSFQHSAAQTCNLLMSKPLAQLNLALKTRARGHELYGHSHICLACNTSGIYGHLGYYCYGW